MQDSEFTERLDAAAGSIDASRWALAELAADCKQAEYEHWAERIGHHKRVRRHPRTVREWAQVAEFRSALDTARVDLPFSFYAVALRFIDKVATEKIVELMNTALAEEVGVEDFEAELRALAGTPDPDPAKKWRKFAEKLYGEIDSYVPAVADHLREAAQALEKAATRLALWQVELEEGTADVPDHAHPVDQLEALADAQSDAYDETAPLEEAEMEI